MNYFVYPGIIQADFYKFCNKAYTGNVRMYDPALGRFLSPDPFMQSSLNTQNFNRYSYCLNNPLKFTDPSGFVYSGATPHSYFSSPSYPVIYGNYGGASLNTYEGPSGGYYLDGMFIPGRFSLCGVGAANIDRIDIGQNNFFNSSTHGNFKKPTVAGSWQTKILYDSWIQVQKPFGTSNDYEEYTCTSETYGEYALTTEFVSTLTDVQKDIVRDVNSETKNSSFFLVSIYWAGTLTTLYEMQEVKYLNNLTSRANAWKKLTSTIPKSLRNDISYVKSITKITKAASRGLLLLVLSLLFLV